MNAAGTFNTSELLNNLGVSRQPLCRVSRLLIACDNVLHRMATVLVQKPHVVDAATLRKTYLLTEFPSTRGHFGCDVPLSQSACDGDGLTPGLLAGD